MKLLSQERLRTLRRVIAVAFFIPASLLFLDFANAIPPALGAFVGSVQLVPALMRILVYGGLASFGLVIVLAATAAFGRVYCSTLCPLGTLQDAVIRVSKRIHRRRRFDYARPHYVLHYTLLALACASAAAGSMLLVNLLEPFSNYGRILADLLEPVIQTANNAAGALLEHFDVYALAASPVRHVTAGAVVLPAVFLAVVVYLSYNHGRLFCNTLCPAGALLGIVSRVSLFRIVIDEKLCNECGACERTCKANCIESSSKRIDHASCVGCFNCITSCPTDGVRFHRVLFRGADRAEFIPSRRTLFKAAVTPVLALRAAFPGIDTSSAARPDTARGYYESRNRPVTPPGSRSVAHFTSFCTACHLCVSSCPTQVLYPSFLEYGIAGIFQPRMNFDASYCNYDCVVCGQVCPSGAILPLHAGAKKEVQIGKSTFVKDDCVVVAKKKDCAACSEHCPTKAVHTVPYEGKLKIPELNNDICVGCGACEHACPTTPRKAIYVSANPVHLKAQKPAIKKTDNTYDGTKEFPF